MPKRESGLRSRIAQHLRSRGYLVLVQHGTAYSGSARSDLIACARGRFLAVEVKRPDGTYRPGQLEFLKQVRRQGGWAFVARSVTDTKTTLDTLEAHMANPTELTLEDLMAQLEAADVGGGAASTADVEVATKVLADLTAQEEADRRDNLPEPDFFNSSLTDEDVQAGGFTPTPVDDAAVDELTLEFERERQIMEQALAGGVPPARPAPTTTDEKLDQILVLMDDMASSVRRLVDSLGASAAPQRAPRKTRTPKAETSVSPAEVFVSDNDEEP